ncbi:MAG: glycoside hydrolase family 3 N-terminal domain-containing protein [bacterium]|nr:glycoside hydrolase family 3 N-terminal domain-containing protein [bacterium]
MVNLREKPFYLNDEQIQWVEETIASMTEDEKVGQLFVQMRKSLDEEVIKDTLDRYHQGGLRWQGGDRNGVYNQNKTYQAHSRIPLLIAANCDNGGDGCLSDGTFVATAVEAAAGEGTKTAYDIGYVAGREASSVGVNWMFNPCADIFMNWRNTIVNTRSFGDNADRVIENIRAFIDGIHQSNVACCCKHFPGDGVEERDQHLVLGVNDLSVEEWDASFRKVYQTMIDEGLESIMVGHIALPEMSRKLRPNIADEDIMPATLAPELLTDLLRGEMGFNGVVITDASHMAGIACMEKREIAVPKAIASGCDMFLFTNDAEEDFGYMKAGIQNGTISEERLSDALHRILGLKARLGLYKKENVTPDAALKETIVGCEEHKKLAEEAAERCITLVKDTKHYLPISPKEKKRARLVFIQSTPTSKGYKGDPVKQVVIEELERAGFSVDVAPNFHDLEVSEGVNPMNMFKMMECGSMKDFASKYDVVFLVLNIKGYAQENNVRLRWSCNHSSELPWYVTEVPTVGISLNYTNHLIDVPQVHTFVHAYGSTRTSIRTAIAKICGESEFKGTASDTVFCGKWDTRL